MFDYWWNILRIATIFKTLMICAIFKFYMQIEFPSLFFHFQISHALYLLHLSALLICWKLTAWKDNHFQRTEQRKGTYPQTPAELCRDLVLLSLLMAPYGRKGTTLTPSHQSFLPLTWDQNTNPESNVSTIYNQSLTTGLINKYWEV